MRSFKYIIPLLKEAWPYLKKLTFKDVVTIFFNGTKEMTKEVFAWKRII